MKRPILCLLVILICLCDLLFLSACAHKFKVLDDHGQVIREIRSHWDQVTYEEMADGRIKMTAGDNRSAWEYIFPAIFQKSSETEIHVGDD